MKNKLHADNPSSQVFKSLSFTFSTFVVLVQQQILISHKIKFEFIKYFVSIYDSFVFSTHCKH